MGYGLGRLRLPLGYIAFAQRLVEPTSKQSDLIANYSFTSIAK